MIILVFHILDREEFYTFEHCFYSVECMFIIIIVGEEGRSNQIMKNSSY